MRAGPLSSCWLICLLLAPAGASGSDVTAAAALAEGRCAEAADLAAVEVLEAPDSQAAWRTLGDAQRCIGAARPAVLAYARYLELAGSDPAVEALVSTLRERLGRLRVTVHTDRPAPLRVEAHPEYGDPVVARLQPDGTWLLPDLEPGTRPTIVVRGTGVEEVRTPAPMILVDDEATLTLSPGWKGIGVLGLSARPPAGTTVEALTVDGWTTVPPDSQVRLTAGEQPVVVAGEHGRVGSMVEVPADGRTLFDPVPWEPTLLTVTGAPAGAELRLFLEGTEPPLERIVTLPRNVGEIDGEFGVRVAPPTPIDSVVGGPGSLVLSHPSLGLAASELVLEPGASNRVELDWRGLEHAPAVRDQYLAWLSERQRLQQTTTAGVVVGAGVGAAGLVLSTIGWIAAGQNSQALADAQSSALAGAEHPDGPDGWLAEHDAAARAERAWVGVGVAGAGVGALGITLAGVFGLDGRARLANHGEWSPP